MKFGCARLGRRRRRAPVGTALFLGVLVAACLVYPVRNYVQLEIRAGASESASTASQASIDAGYRFTCIVQGGGVQCWGRNSNGELGDGSTTDRSRAVTVLTSASPSTPLTGVTAIASGRLHACALTSAGGVKCWGYNNYGQLGDGTTTNRNVATDVSGLTSGVAAIAAGQNHTCARLTVGTVKCWGSNNQGQLGTGNQADSSTPVSVSSIAGAVLIAAGQQHTCASTSDGAMKCWGYGMNYQLGTGTTSMQTSPASVLGLSATVSAISAGYLNTCALLSTGKVECWGNNSNGQLGNGDATGSIRTSPVTVKVGGSDLTNVSVISVAEAGWACAVTTSNKAYCWGGNFGFNLGAYFGGVSQTSAQEFTALGTTVAAITTGEYHGCAKMTDGSLKCWGENSQGEIGNGTTTGDNATFVSQRSIPVAPLLVDSTAPTFSSAAVNAAGTKVVLTYSEALSATTAGGSDFSVMVGGVSRSVSSVAVSGSTVELTLASAVVQGETVTVAYTDPTAGNDSSAVQDSAGNDAASLSATSVTNNSTVDGTAPTFVSAATNTAGTTITLTYSEALSATTAGGSDFSVMVAGVSRSVSGVAVSGSTVVLTLASAVGEGQSVTVAYTQPGSANAVKDSAGNKAASLSATSVSNQVDTTGPAFVSAATNAAGTTVTLTFSEALSATTAAANRFSVIVDGVAITPSAVSVSGSTVVLTISPAVERTASVTVNYTDPTGGDDANAVQDSNGNDASSITSGSVTNASTVDTTVPTFVSASTSTNGATITLTYSEALSATTAATSAYTVLVDGVSRSVSSASVSGSTVVLTLASAVGAGQSVTVAYADPTAGNDASAVQDSAGNDAASLSATAVTNNVPAPEIGPDPGTTSTTVAPVATTSSTTTSTTVAPVATTSSVRPPRTTITTVRSPRTTTTVPVPVVTSTSSSTTTTSSTSTTIRPILPTTTSTTSSTTTLAVTANTLVPTTTTTPTTSVRLASATLAATTTTTTLAIAAVDRLREAQMQVPTLEQLQDTTRSQLDAARQRVVDALLEVLEPTSAIVVAVKEAMREVQVLQQQQASAASIQEATTRLEALRESIAENVTISPDQVVEAKRELDAVLADPTASEEEVAAARAALADIRTPGIEEVEEVLAATEPKYWEPVVIRGVVDSPRPGNIVLLDDGQSKSLQVVRINKSALRLESNDGFALTITTRDMNGVPFQLGEGGSIIVKHGNFIAIAGQGFAGSTLAKTWLFSSPREIGSIDVNADGSFAAEHPIGDDVKVGVHTAQVNGLAPNGETRSLSISVEVLPNEGPAPYDPLAKRSDVARLFAELLSLLVVVGAGVGGASRRDDDGSGGNPDDDDASRTDADVREVSGQAVAAYQALRTDRFNPPTLRVLERLLAFVQQAAADRSALLARVATDANYLRALSGMFSWILTMLAVVCGVLAASDVDFIAGTPSLWLILAIVVVGILDASAGLVATAVFTLLILILGGVETADSVRGMLGLAVLSFGVPLIAGVVRPFRRSAYDVSPFWTRVSDVVVISLIGAWSAGSMFNALPALFGVTYDDAGQTRVVQFVVLLALVVRYALEQAATYFTASRLAGLDAMAATVVRPRKVLSALLQTAVFMFVAVVFIGNSWVLWLGALIYLAPRLVALAQNRFPKGVFLGRILPRGIVGSVLMLLVAKLLARTLDSTIDDAAAMLNIGFIVMALPGLALTALGWFAKSSTPRKDTPATRIGGSLVVALGVLIVLGIVNF